MLSSLVKFASLVAVIVKTFSPNWVSKILSLLLIGLPFNRAVWLVTAVSGSSMAKLKLVDIWSKYILPPMGLEMVITGGVVSCGTGGPIEETLILTVSPPDAKSAP